MITALNAADFERIRRGYDDDPAASLSLQAEAYTSADWFRAVVCTRAHRNAIA